MGLDSFKGGAESSRAGVKWSKNKLHVEEMCPCCGTTNTEEVSFYWRCNNPSCDILNYIPVTE